MECIICGKDLEDDDYASGECTKCGEPISEENHG